jgi:sigma-B regulation protein RsbQ
MKESFQKKYNIHLTGKGTVPILFSHGYGCNQSMWRYLTPYFEEHFKIILFDLMGNGNSDSSFYDYQRYNSLQGYAEDVVEILVRLNLEPIIFVGHSVSSIIGMLAAIQNPELFKKIVMIGPSPCYLNKEEYKGGFSEADLKELSESLDSNYLGWTSAITPVIANTPDRPEIANELKNSFCRNHPDIAKHFAKVTFSSDNREDLSLLKTETLIIQTNPDLIAPVPVGEYMNKNISNSELIIVNTPGHCPHLSAPQLIIDPILSFIQSQAHARI